MAKGAGVSPGIGSLCAHAGGSRQGAVSASETVEVKLGHRSEPELGRAMERGLCPLEAEEVVQTLLTDGL